MAGQKRKCCEECPGDDTCQHATVCMCGSSMDHSPWDGHQPVSMHDYYCEPVEPARNDANDFCALGIHIPGVTE